MLLLLTGRDPGSSYRLLLAIITYGRIELAIAGRASFHIIFMYTLIILILSLFLSLSLGC